MLYFYKLGHCADFGLAEFEFLTGNQALWSDKNWLIGESFCDTSQCGSLVFGGCIVDLPEILPKEKKVLEQKMSWQAGQSELKNRPQSFEPNYKSKINSNSATNSGPTSTNFAENLRAKITLQAAEFGVQLEKYLSQSLPKKLLISVLTKAFDSQKIFQIGKKAGISKLNLIDKLPNFGHFKASKNQLIIINNPLNAQFAKTEFDSGKNFQLTNLTNLPFLLLQVQSFADQGYWANLDQNLTGEMSRGLMNLKLARTLLNLTDKTTIWDPFCGSGRTLAAGWDLGKKFILSDLEEACQKEVAANFNYLQKMNSRKDQTQKFPASSSSKASINTLANSDNSSLETSSKTPKSTLLANLTLDAANLTQIVQSSPFASVDWQEGASSIAIVTEGWLGENFKKPPTASEISEQFKRLEKIWQKVLWESARLKIEELIFCLPFYPSLPSKAKNPTKSADRLDQAGTKLNPVATKNSWPQADQNLAAKLTLPPFINSILGNSSYQISPLAGQKYLLYSRSDSLVGHLVIKLNLKS